MSPFLRVVKGPGRLAASCALALCLTAGLGTLGAQAANDDVLSVTLDHASIARLPDGAKTLVIGSPIVADVTMIKGSNTMVVTGKGFGETNLIALDGQGNVLAEKIIRVEPTNSVLVVQRGMDRESYSCAPKCMPVVQLGDGSEFTDASGQITARNALAQPSAGAGPAMH